MKSSVDRCRHQWPPPLRFGYVRIRSCVVGRARPLEEKSRYGHDDVVVVIVVVTVDVVCH